MQLLGMLKIQMSEKLLLYFHHLLLFCKCASIQYTVSRIRHIIAYYRPRCDGCIMYNDFRVNKLFWLFCVYLFQFVLTLFCFELHISVLHALYFAKLFIIYVLYNLKMFSKVALHLLQKCCMAFFSDLCHRTEVHCR